MSKTAAYTVGIPEQGASAAAVALSGLVALAVAMGIGRFAFTPLLPMMQEDAGLSVGAGGWLASANYFGYLFGALLAMWLPMRAQAAIRFGLAAIGLGTIAMGLVDNFAAWLVLRAIAGVASAWVFVSASAWCLERLAPLRSPFAGGIVFGGVGAGIAASGGLCLVLMHAGASSAQAWIVFGVLALVLSAGVWSAFGASADSNAGAGADSIGGARSASRVPHWDRESLRLIVCYTASGFSYIVPATFLPLMAKRAISDPLIFGWSWPVFGAAALVSTLGVTLLSRWADDRRLWSAGHFVMALGIAIPVLRPGIAGIMVAALLVGSTFMVTTMTAMREARRVGGRHATGLIAAMTAAFAAGQIAGPIVAACLAGRGEDFSTALLAASAVLVISGFALLSRARPD